MKLTIAGKMSNGSVAPLSELKNLRWAIQDTSIARIEGNRIIPIKQGSTKLIANADGIITYIDINVIRNGLATLAVNKPKVTIPKGSVINIDMG